MSSAVQQVTDVNGVRYKLRRQLGRGGQGAVFEVAGGRLAAKLIFDNSPTRRERLLNQLTSVKRLPLQDLGIARPLEMLRKPHLGYVMELLTGMVPLKAIAFVPDDEPSLVQWYLATGGLRRRLRVLARAAEALAQLHGKGLVYSDPSPDNIFVSATKDAHEVRLIDADNLHYNSSPSDRFVFTPGYGAPELVSGRSGVNSLTDAHAFAVLAFQALSLVHPLIGDTVATGPPEAEEEALAGKLPWIDAPEDVSNRATSGIPRDLVLSPRLAELFNRTFGAGLTDPTARPGMAEWSERLNSVADATILCPACTGTYYFTSKCCRWCDSTAPRFVTAVVYLWDPSGPPGNEILQKPEGGKLKPVIAGVATLSDGDPLVLTSRLACMSPHGRPELPLLELRLEGSNLMLRSLNDRTWSLMAQSGKQEKRIGSAPVALPLAKGQSAWRLHLGAPEQLHRVVRFELREGEQP